MSSGTDRAVGALLGVAVGDAAGWPFERADRTRGRVEPGARWFTAWRRNAGNRFRPFMEDVAPGEYSDDTQMTLAVARARRWAGEEWARWLAAVEWPFLLQYERGAGATVKRACRAWAAGQPPWAVRKADERRKYAASGANGVAMRVVPHVLAHRADEEFGVLAADVLRDGALTHGHPRALLGGLVHAHALWTGLRSPGPPQGGAELVDGLRKNARAWAGPWWRSLGSDWLDAVEEGLGGSYQELWEATAQEVLDRLDASLALLDRGPAEPAEVGAALAEWGLTKRAVNGSGTLCAVGAVHLAAVFLGGGEGRADPAAAVLTAARLPGADTDTLASMTASLVGARLGTGWMGVHATEVQDAGLLAESASGLDRSGVSDRGADRGADRGVDRGADRGVEQDAPGSVPEPGEVRARITRFTEALDAVPEPGTVLSLPDGRSAAVQRTQEAEGGSWRALRSRLRVEDGQTLVVLHGVHRA